MLDVKDSLDRLEWTAEHHFLHIQNHHEFMRAWAIQFELAYTDFRTIQMALQIDGSYHELLANFTAQYDKVYAYEYEFAAGGLDGFYAKYHEASDLESYQKAQESLREYISDIRGIMEQSLTEE
ncbi:hypothetical protein FEZ51_01135 [Pediococcus stilesii]|uniref:Uncharacterized protein n=1 Tax=Pediococcus stilesii TaxID=331679 RepID=A0A5R9BZ70_9LACO|nr:hypothetical protein [Pediococcus stilesii]TLQ05815.1 hypothetical protein FEZ51_01135 [Pediococcus stilesii]